MLQGSTNKYLFILLTALHDIASLMHAYYTHEKIFTTTLYGSHRLIQLIIFFFLIGTMRIKISLSDKIAIQGWIGIGSRYSR